MHHHVAMRQTAGLFGTVAVVVGLVWCAAASVALRGVMDLIVQTLEPYSFDLVFPASWPNTDFSRQLIEVGTLAAVLVMPLESGRSCLVQLGCVEHRNKKHRATVMQQSNNNATRHDHINVDATAYTPFHQLFVVLALGGEFLYFFGRSVPCLLVLLLIQTRSVSAVWTGCCSSTNPGFRTRRF
jgi:hypothetical protein